VRKDARALTRRRAELVERSARLRAQIAATGASLEARLARADRVVTAARAHPVLTGLAAAGAAFLLRRRLPSAFRVLRLFLLLRGL
jgi:sigma54-dependent transcription regulator